MKHITLEKDIKDVVVSVILPVYNEIRTIENVINILHATDFKKELIVIDDGSTDGSRELLKKLRIEKKIDKLILNKKNMGKGASLRRGFKAAAGDLVIVQDADLEYDPNDIKLLIVPFVESDAEVVYGSRYLKGNKYRVDGFYHEFGNKVLTGMSNICSDLSLTDMETCYKMFLREVIQSTKLCENRFGFEPEVTAKIAKQKRRIYEIPISYSPRTFEEGKKIGVKDAFRAIWCILKYNFFR